MALLAACATMNTLGLWSIGSANDSFYGVSFGDTPATVRLRYRQGEPQTSPSGAPAWRVRNVSEDGITLSELIYEFTGDGGMQLAMAMVDPAACAPLRSQLSERFGAPARAAALASPGHDLFMWHPSDGESVTLNCGTGWFVMLGPQGNGLMQDIELVEHRHDSAS